MNHKVIETTVGKPENSQSEVLLQELLPKRFSTKGKIWVGILVLFCLVGAFAYYRQLRYGLAVTAMRDYASWGIYISNFVFFVAISLVGSLITAILRLSKVQWSTPLVFFGVTYHIGPVTGFFHGLFVQRVYDVLQFNQGFGLDLVNCQHTDGSMTVVSPSEGVDAVSEQGHTDEYYP